MSFIKIKVIQFHLVQSKLWCIFLPLALKQSATTVNLAAHGVLVVNKNEMLQNEKIKC